MVSEVSQPGKFVETLGVLWFQSPKMACNAYTAAEDTIKHYSHVCSNILEHFEKKNSTSTLSESTHHQILTIGKTNCWSMYIYILKLINVLRYQLVEKLTFVNQINANLTIAGDGAGKEYECKKNKLHDSDTHSARLNSPSFLFLFSKSPNSKELGI